MTAPADEPPALAVVTAWTGVDPMEPDEVKDQAAVRDQLFRLRVREVLNEHAPWLVPILHEARATIVAGPGQFFVMFGDDPSRSVEIPQLGAHLLLLPWREDGQKAN